MREIERLTGMTVLDQIKAARETLDHWRNEPNKNHEEALAVHLTAIVEVAETARLHRHVLLEGVRELLEWATPSDLPGKDPRWQQSHTSELVPRFTEIGGRKLEERLKAISERTAVIEAQT